MIIYPIAGLLLIALIIILLMIFKKKYNIEVVEFGKTHEGETANLYTLKNSKGSVVKITNFGGIVVSLEVPDKNGNLRDVVLGYKEFDGYLENKNYFGCIIGRFGNRIANGKFEIDGTQYTLATNNGPNHLHGGIKGFNKVVWDAKPVSTNEGPGLELYYVSKDGEEGYPGNLNVKTTYIFTEKDELKIIYRATTDKSTVVNLTHHSYFNLTGEGHDTILDHEIMINAAKFTPADENSVPTGELRDVIDTPFDFTGPHKISERINDDNEQLKFANGYDQNWVLNKAKPGQLSFAARVYEKTSSRIMDVYTSEPGMQFYTGNFLDGSDTGKSGKSYKQRSGLCLEPQHYPDSPNKPEFPPVILKPGQVYKNTIIYQFSVKK